MPSNPVIYVLALFLFSVKLIGEKRDIDTIPSGFVYLRDIDSTILEELRYFRSDNFIGSTIDGYDSASLVLSRSAAVALSQVQADLKRANKGLKIFDAYRPQKAVDHFVLWAQDPLDTLMKSEFYPNIPKNELFKRGYIATRSGHTRGSTVDLTIVDLHTHKELDMGGPFDFFGVQSHHDHGQLTTEQRSNRAFLKSIMIKHGFRPYAKEWWHYTLNAEPYPNTYFDFNIK